MTADKRRIDACMKACEGISTQNLEDNVPFLELARRYNALLRDNTALQAKVEAMERQEPVGWFARIDGDGPLMECKHADISRVPLYTFPGAQPAPSIPSTELRHVIEWLRNGCDPMKAADELEMLAAAPEAKP